MKTLRYKNLILTTKDILFDVQSFKIFRLNEKYKQDFSQSLVGKIDDDRNRIYKNGIEAFKKISIKIIDGHLLMILKKFEGAVKYV